MSGKYLSTKCLGWKSDTVGKNAVMNAWVKTLTKQEQLSFETHIESLNKTFKNFGEQSAKELLFELFKYHIEQRS